MMTRLGGCMVGWGRVVVRMAVVVAVVVVAAMVWMGGPWAAGDTLILNDGKKVEGAVMKAGDRYWVQTPDGKSQYVAVESVKEWVKNGNGEGSAGGALVDKYGQVMGVVTMKSRTTSMGDSYGMAISAGRVRQFLAANKVAAVAGADEKVLSAEEIVAKIKGAAVCIISVQ